MSSCIEFYNVTNLPDIMEYAYDRYTDVSLLVCSIFILTSLTNLCAVNTLNKKINNINQIITNTFTPPEYKN